MSGSARGFALLLALAPAACAVSEQEGRLQPAGNPRFHVDSQLGEVVFHFDSTFNKAAVFGRSAALALLALFVFRAGARTRSVLTSLVAIIALGLAVWLLARDLPALAGYEVRVGKGGLDLSIPPDPPRHIEWRDLDEMRISGYEWIGAGRRAGSGPDFGRLPEWRSMELRLGDGEEIFVDLERLSVEHRQNFWRAIASHSELSEERPPAPTFPGAIPDPR